MLNALSPDVLYTRFGISRVSQINGFDWVGLPVFSVTRPEGLSVSINSGKGLSPMMARAGAVAEGIEFSYAENPQILLEDKTLDEAMLEAHHAVQPEEWSLARGATLNPHRRYTWDDVSRLEDPNGTRYLIPSELLYIAEARKSHLMHFQASTNGWASGASLDDAILSGLYEVVERDNWTLWRWQIEKRAYWPGRLDTDVLVRYPAIAVLIERIQLANLRCFCFDISTDTALPAVWAILYDLNPVPAGVFSGFGCAGSMDRALERAITESIQSRSCYIAGARDDLFRRSFLMMKNYDIKSSIEVMENSPISYSTYRLLAVDPLVSAAEELQLVTTHLAAYGFKDFYFKNAGTPFAGNPFSVVKVYSPCLEQYYCPHWTPSKRFYAYVGQT